jgi:hypothetical protein
MKLRRLTRNSFSAMFTLIVALALVGTASAGSETFTGSSGGLSASAQFTLTGSTLTVVLTNTSTGDVLVPTDVLTALWFNNTNLLTPVSASLNGSTVYYGTITNDGNGWGYYSGLGGGAHGKNDGITSVGFGIGGGHANFGNGSALQGIDYGLLSAGDNSATGNGGITGGGPLVKNSGLFTFTVANGFSLSELGNTVVFQYGSNLTDTSYTGNLTPVPEPSALLVCLSGLFSAGFLMRRKLTA